MSNKSSIYNDNFSDGLIIEISSVTTQDPHPQELPYAALLEITNMLNTDLPNPTNVLADDGISSSQTNVTWNYSSGIDIDGFLIFRDNEEIGNINKFQRSFADADGIPGKIYTYTIRPFKGENRKNVGTFNQGYKKADGKISGSVKTLMGNAPISGVTITIKGKIGVDTPAERPFNDETTTNVNGEFSFDAVNYGEEGGEYTVTATYKDHTFFENEVLVFLNTTTKQAQVQFFDEVAYVISGIVKHEYEAASCGLEGVKVSAYAIINGGDPVPTESITNEEGQYNLVVDPNQSGLEKIYLVIDTLQLLGEPGQAIKDSIVFAFTAQADTVFNTATDFKQLIINEITEVNFYQTIKQEVTINLRNTCGGAIEGEQFKVRIRDQAGCFDTIVDLDASGLLTIPLPPIDGLMISAHEAVNNTTIGSIVLDYLRYRPATLNLKTLHQQYTKGLIDAEELAEETLVDLTFHVTPAITYTQFGAYICEDIPVKLTQKATYSVNLNIFENHGGINCGVKEGYVIINNPAADSIHTQQLRIDYNESELGFPPYTFRAGNPNPVPPYLWGMEVQYFSKNGDYLKTETIPIGVEGSIAVPGYDVIVDPNDEGIPYPLFILRDPPGDGSSSTIESGQTFSTSIAHSRETSTGTAFKNTSDVEIFSVGASLELEINGNFTENESDELTISGTFKQSISTSEDAIGEAGDIIVGMGLAYQYGLIEKITISDCGVPKKEIILGFTPNSVTTTWFYTVSHIEGIIVTNQTQLDALEMLPAEEKKKKALEIDKLTASIKNWNEILRYHREETVPHRLLCKADYSKEIGNPFILNEAKKFQTAFCDSYSDADLIWDDAVINAYNQAITGIKNLLDPSISELDKLLYWSFDPTRFANEEYGDPVFDNTFGKAAENLTFSGQTSITRTVGLARSQTNEINLGGSVGGATGISTSISNKVEVVTGGG